MKKRGQGRPAHGAPEVMLGRTVTRHSPASMRLGPSKAEQMMARLIAEQIAQQKKEGGGDQSGLGSMLGGMGGGGAAGYGSGETIALGSNAGYMMP